MSWVKMNNNTEERGQERTSAVRFLNTLKLEAGKLQHEKEWYVYNENKIKTNKINLTELIQF